MSAQKSLRVFAAEGAAGAEHSAPFQPQLNFSSYSRAPAAVVDKPDDTKLLEAEAEAPTGGKGRRYATHRPTVVLHALRVSGHGPQLHCLKALCGAA